MFDGRTPVIASIGTDMKATDEWVGWTGSNMLNSEIGLFSQAKGTKNSYRGLSIKQSAANRSVVGLAGEFGENSSTDVRGAQLYLTRAADGLWSCTVVKGSSNLKDKFAPKACTVGTAPTIS